MEYNVEQHRGLLKQASEQLKTSQEVIAELASQVTTLQHKLASRDLAVKLASAGQVAMAELSEKVAEFEQKSDEDLALEEKIASHVSGPRHQLHQTGAPAPSTGIMDFLNPR